MLQVVSEPEHRGPHHVPARILRVAGGEEVVGAVLQAPLARHNRHIPQGMFQSHINTIPQY